MYDAKQIEANALFAGFSDVKINEIIYVDSKNQRKMETLCITFVKPERKIPDNNSNNFCYQIILFVFILFNK